MQDLMIYLLAAIMSITLMGGVYFFAGHPQGVSSVAMSQSVSARGSGSGQSGGPETTRASLPPNGADAESYASSGLKPTSAMKMQVNSGSTTDMDTASSNYDSPQATSNGAMDGSSVSTIYSPSEETTDSTNAGSFASATY